MIDSTVTVSPPWRRQRSSSFSATSRSSRLGEASASALGASSGAKIACSRKPQKNREWLGQYPQSAASASAERLTVSRLPAHSSGVESTSSRSSWNPGLYPLLPTPEGSTGRKTIAGPLTPNQAPPFDVTCAVTRAAVAGRERVGEDSVVLNED